MPKYEFDAERWLRSNAALYERKGSPQMARNMELCADEIKALRARFAYWQDDMNAVLKHRDDLHARVVRLEEALKRGVELHENCDADTCICGESMLHPLADHKPTAMLQYYGDQWAEEARRALEEK